jgi:putative inorganic carbon (hco3(-)) transporter
MTAAAAQAHAAPPTDRRLSRSPTVLLSLAIGAEIFSGNWKYLGIPLGLDRILLAAGLAALVLGGARAVSEQRLRLRPLHYVLLAAATYATASAIAANTFAQSDGGFALLDRFGLIPFLMFFIAPLVFGRRDQRNILLGVLVTVGAYLGTIAVLEGVGLGRFALPSYINDPTVGLHFGRARGPFVEAAADGLSLYMCGVAAVVGLTTWRSRAARWTCGVVVVLCGMGIVFTLTRAVWLGAVIGTLAAMLASRRLRRVVLPVTVVVLLGVAAVFYLTPGLQSKAATRVEDQRPVWDRYNTNQAAIRMFETRPFFGFGWQTFSTVGPDYLRQADSYPLTGAGLEVHNVFLSHAAELGIVGSVLWALSLFGAVGGAILRRGPPDVESWKLGLIAIFVAFLVVANLGPLSYPFPNLLLWTWAGVVSASYFLTPNQRMTTDANAIEDGPPPDTTSAVQSRGDRLSLTAEEHGGLHAH